MYTTLYNIGIHLCYCKHIVYFDVDIDSSEGTV